MGHAPSLDRNLENLSHMELEVNSTTAEAGSAGDRSTAPPPPQIEIQEVFLQPLAGGTVDPALVDTPLDLTSDVVELFRSYLSKGLLADGARLARFAGPGVVRDTALG